MTDQDKPTQLSEKAQSLLSHETALRTAFKTRDALAAERAANAMFDEIHDQEKGSPSILQVKQADEDKDRDPLFDLNHNGNPLRLVPTAWEKLKELNQERVNQLKSPEGQTELKNDQMKDADSLSTLKPDEIGVAGQKSTDEDMMRIYPNTKAIVDFKQHLRDAFSVNAAEGMQDYLLGVNQQLQANKSGMQIEFVQYAKGLAFDQSMKFGNYGILRITEKTGRRSELEF